MGIASGIIWHDPSDDLSSDEGDQAEEDNTVEVRIRFPDGDIEDVDLPTFLKLVNRFKEIKNKQEIYASTAAYINSRIEKQMDTSDFDTEDPLYTSEQFQGLMRMNDIFCSLSSEQSYNNKRPDLILENQELYIEQVNQTGEAKKYKVMNCT